MRKLALDDEILLIDVLTETKLCQSRGEAKKLIQQGGVSIEEEKVSDLSYKFNREILKDGKWVDIDLYNSDEVHNFKKYMQDNYNIIISIHETRHPSKLTKVIWFIEDSIKVLKETIEEILPYI